MATNVFISWSGDLSRKLAEALHQWLPSTLQFVRPYFSPSDIEKGTKWSSEISQELANSDIGIICLTRDNLDKPWVVFESGALSKNLDESRVCTVLFGVEPTDLKGPLTLFQHTLFKKDDFKRLFTTINNAGGDSRLDDATRDNVFEKWWPDLEEQVSSMVDSAEAVQALLSRLNLNETEKKVLLLRWESGGDIPDEEVAKRLGKERSTITKARRSIKNKAIAANLRTIILS